MTWENKEKLIQEDEVGIWGVVQNPHGQNTSRTKPPSMKPLAQKILLGQNLPGQALSRTKPPRRKTPSTKPIWDQKKTFC